MAPAVSRTMPQMRAIRVHEHGGPAVLTEETVPRPEPGPGELLVRVRAAGVNPIDWLVREGYADEALDPDLPWTPGWDLAGDVVAAGADVSEFEPGDPVFGLVSMPDPGETYAEFAAVPATDVIARPPAISSVVAGGVPMVGLTAWRSLFGAADVGPDDRVLIHAAGGGVGHLATQLAARAGAHVVGTASGANEAFVRGLGADEFVNYREAAFESAVDPVDVVLDAVGGETLERSLEAVAPGGTVVTLPEPPSADVLARARADRDAVVEWFSVEPDAAVLEILGDRLAAGSLEVEVAAVLPLSDAARAQERSRAGHVRGTLVLRPGAAGD